MAFALRLRRIPRLRLRVVRLRLVLVRARRRCRLRWSVVLSALLACLVLRCYCKRKKRVLLHSDLMHEGRKNDFDGSFGSLKGALMIFEDCRFYTPLPTFAYEICMFFG